jgi:hypothetical protein
LILGKLTVSGRVRTEYNPCFYRTRRRWGQEPVCAYGMRIYMEGRKIRSGLGGDRTGGVLQVAAEKGLDSKLPRGSYCADPTRVRSIAGRRVATVVSKFRRITEICCRVGVLHAGEVSSELPSTITIAAPRGTVLKEKVLTLSARIFGFFARCLPATPVQ